MVHLENYALAFFSLEMKMNAHQQWLQIVYPDLRFLILRGIVGASRKVTDVLKDREWVTLPRWVKERIKYKVHKLQNDKMSLEDWVDQTRKEIQEHARSKKES